jgi:hypothetical protein
LVSSAFDVVVQVGDARGRDGLDQAQADVPGECREERPARAEKDRHLVQDQLADQAGGQRRRDGAAALEADVLAAGLLARAEIASSMPVVTSVCRSPSPRPAPDRARPPDRAR